jgi:DNA/RNA endonuclease G (NUC1)
VEKIENYTRSIAKTYGNIYVITGPVYLCNPCNSIGKSMVAVPTHIFKIICQLPRPKGRGLQKPYLNRKSPNQLKRLAWVVNTSG